MKKRPQSFRWSLASKARGVVGDESVELTPTGAAAAAAAAAAELTADQPPSDDAEVSSIIPSWGGLFTKESRERGVFRNVRVLGRDENAARRSGWICCAGATFGSNYITTAKYNIFTFIPKSIAEQFRRVANFWFLIMSFIMILGEYFPQLYVSPVNGWSAFGPLCIVISVTMLKVGLEDIARHAADFRVNWGRTVVALTGAPSADAIATGEAHDTLRWRDVRCGDILVLRADRNVPADVVIVATSEDGGFCHIETSNIDGETNLKVRQAVQGVASALCGEEAPTATPREGSAAGLNETLAKLARMRATVHCEVPNPRIHKFVGSLVATSDGADAAEIFSEGSVAGDAAGGADVAESATETGATQSGAAKLPLSNTNVVLRGSTLRNCGWACGIVVYSGKQTKLMMKTSASSHVKFSRMESLVNNCIYVILAFLILMSLIASANKQIASTLLTEHWYLQFEDSTTILPGWGGKFVSDFLTFLILFYNFVPLSVYITMEAVNLFHAFFIDWDAAMYDVRSDTAAHARTAALSEDLGQIEYIFSDKTGTLTQNAMVFRACTIAPSRGRSVAPDGAAAEGVVSDGAQGSEGRTYGKVSTMDAEAKARATAAGASPRSSAMSTMDEEADGAIAASAAALRASRCEECKLGAVECLICGDCGCVDGGCCRAWAKTPFCAFAADAVDGLGWKLRALATADATSAVFRSRAVSDAANGGVRDADLPVFDAGLRRAVMGAHDSVLSDRRRRLSGEESGAQPRAAPGMAPLDMMQCLAVCHTVVPAVVESAPGAKQSVIRYEAESPDEGALVNAAAAYGWRLTQRTHSEITVAVRTDRQDRSSFTIAQLEAKGSAPGHERRSSTVEAEEVWQVLALNKFSSARKCMSMLTRRPADGKAVLWVKGADSVMLAKSLDVREGDDAAEAGGGAHGEHVRAWLAQELDRFARAGLRTLILGKRELEEDEVKAWLCEYDAAMNADDRDSALAEAAVSIERGVELVGATGIEDKLQEGVPGTIADLAVAGIKLWVLTGDKMETAINIGQTCNLLREGMDVIELRGGESAGVSARVAELYRTHVIESDRSDAEREKSLLDRIASVPLTGLADVDALRKCCRPHVNRFIGWSSCCRQNAATSDGATPTSASANDNASTSNPMTSLATDPAGDGDGEIGGGRDGAASTSSAQLAIVVDGEALLELLPNPESSLHFELLARQCATVIACRVSPTQKAMMVKLIKDKVIPEPLTLAIGDGANDVDMIQAAGVGIGISGKEGLQAVNASDYSIAQFRFLRPLLLVHGRWNYRRMSMVLLYSFYKNITVALGAFTFSFFSGWSGQTPFDSWFYSQYNWLLGLPIVVLGLLNRDLSAKTVLRDPRVYVSGRKNMDIGPLKMLIWIANAIVSVAICFIIPWMAYTCYDFAAINNALGTSFGGSTSLGQKHAGLWVFGSTVFTGIVNAMHMRAALETLTWTWLQLIVFGMSFVYYFGFLLIYSYMLDFAPTFYQVGYAFLNQPSFWLCSFLLVPAASWTFDATMRYCKLQLCPTVIDYAIERERFGWSVPPDASQAAKEHGAKWSNFK